MKPFIKLAFTVAIISSAFMSCNKKITVTPTNTNTNTNGYYVNFKLNGTQYNLGVKAVGASLDSIIAKNVYGSNCAFSILGYGILTGDIADQIEINLGTAQPLVAGTTYSSANLSYGNIIYEPNVGGEIAQIYQAGGPGVASQIIVTITAITPSSITGTFSGTLYQTSSASPTTPFALTDGEFYAQL